MYIVLFATIASVTTVKTPEASNVVMQEVPKTKVDSVIQMANVLEKKIDKKIMAKISDKNSKMDSLENIIKIQKAEIRRYKKLLKRKKWDVKQLN